MTGQQLKNSILQMAIQGKLVPQDPHDEPASVLLERIREEKKRLVKEGVLKKKKYLSLKKKYLLIFLIVGCGVSYLPSHQYTEVNEYLQDLLLRQSIQDINTFVSPI